MSAMSIKRGFKGEPITKWQLFLRGLGFDIVADGYFGEKTENATIEFQKRNGIKPADGVVGNCTLGAAMAVGYEVLSTGHADDLNYPEKPDSWMAITHADRVARFGSFDFEPFPTAGNPEGIRITKRSPEYRIAEVYLPKLIGFPGFPRSGRILFHASAVESLVGLVDAWDKANLLRKILSWGGSYVPRYVRGSRTTLSNHSWGTALDINAAWNGLGRMPAKAGETGSVRDLAAIAIQRGWFWGGHFKNPDGMHIEMGPHV